MCYRPALFFHHLRPIALSFRGGKKIWFYFQKFYFISLPFKKLRKSEISLLEISLIRRISVRLVFNVWFMFIAARNNFIFTACICYRLVCLYRPVLLTDTAFPSSVTTRLLFPSNVDQLLLLLSIFAD
jgi:hypothetical protein